MNHWLVIGGGVMGLRVAQEILDRGHHVTIAEAGDCIGGLTSAWKLGDVHWDRFYHVTLLSDDVLRGQLDRLGLEKEIRWVETKTGFFAGGKLHSMSNTLEFLRFPPLGWIERLRLGGTIFLASKIKNWRRMEQVSVESWLRKWSGRGAFEKIWLPLLKAKLGTAYPQTSAAFIWAHTARMYKARRSGAKKEMFGYVPGGYRRILGAWSEQLQNSGASIRLSSPVREVCHEAGDGASAPLRVTFADGSQAHYDQVVSTIASPLIADSCPQLSADEQKKHRGIRYLGVVCGSMLLKKPISPYYVTNITDTWVPLTGVIEMSTIVDSQQELGGHHLVYLPQYMPDDDPDLGESEDTYRERCLQTLEKMYSHFDRADVVDFRVSRAKYVAALSTIDYSTRLPPVVTSVPGFYALNSAHILEGNLNVNETLTLGTQKFQAEVWPDWEKRNALSV
ncbi:MAG: NAD(P)/FAD-dependent oxidoreductase [Planctomycetota bacterium]